jgi:hypothetical protein
MFALPFPFKAYKHTIIRKREQPVSLDYGKIKFRPGPAFFSSYNSLLSIAMAKKPP